MAASRKPRPEAAARARALWRAAPVVLLGLLAGCGNRVPAVLDDRELPTPRPEALSLLSRPLYRPPLPAERERTLQAQLDSAAQRYMDDPESADGVLWLGRRLAYLGRYREAIAVFSAALERHPQDARFYRHRGHRYITTRQLDLAVADLTHAANLTRGQPDELEPDGQPNAANVPTSTLQGNIYYHLALAQYLRRDFEAARAAWEQALARATTDDMRVAVSDWLYLTLRRLGRPAEAERVLEVLTPDLTILENQAYHSRLRLYRGELPPDSLLDVHNADDVQIATYAYGVASWYRLSGQHARAEALLRRILTTPNWAAFGYIAAEAELASRRAPPRT